MKRYLIPALLSSAIAAMPHSVNAQDTNNSPEKSEFLDSLLIDKVDYYRRLYPEISFLILHGGDETVADMMALDLLLGHEPKSLDYEHPPELREDLMMASANRVWLMLQYRMPSATLFMADDPIVSQAHICVLTIDPEEIASDVIQATGHLLDMPEKFIRKIPEDLQLQSAEYLAYVADHEVYHCLQSMYVGPQLMSHKESWGEYNHFLNELGADAYAIAMHIKTVGKASPFARNIKRIRGLSIYNGEPDYMTCNAVDQVLNIPAKKITEMSAKEIFDMASRIKSDLTISYDEYIQYLASAVQAMKELGADEVVTEELQNRIKNTQADPAVVKEIIKNSRRNLAELSGNKPE